MLALSEGRNLSEIKPDGGHALLTLTTEIVSAHVMNNSVGINDLPGLIGSVHAALVGLGSPAEQAVELKPAVPVKSSIKTDYIVCLADGVKLKMRSEEQTSELKSLMRTSYAGFCLNK